LALAERHHDGLRDVPAFGRPGLEALIPQLRALTRQEPVAAIEETVMALREVGVVLCFIPAVPGGYAVQAHGFVDRVSKDMDLFTTMAAAPDFPAVQAAVVAALRAAGLEVTVEREGPSFARLAVTDPGAGSSYLSCKNAVAPPVRPRLYVTNTTPGCRGGARSTSSSPTAGPLQVLRFR
jgi:hypothetical protein